MMYVKKLSNCSLMISGVIYYHPPPTPNGLCRHVQAIPFSRSDHLMPVQSIQCGGGWCRSTPEIIKEQLLNFVIYIVPPG
jgi:hypothetical protein